ncbi:glycosyltransferase family 4 protein [Nocardiopsis changdeensis]|uniref:Glycosyltransferase family 4 protein n=1 Tax=Nocardiopsis changdeensis TaxID=2831969 RepID=A0ABX8BH93_9ACTN|nr:MULTISPECIES: glycosyltransferase family 4 protein [Nocardiopsis]QUX21590.1 glycosyltransferase family 4 protein [Nocardiopsis changdeensis]QYX37525.1 glycosyltransferase family 4 protein [Nocardiopsis sp. MT53]
MKIAYLINDMYGIGGTIRTVANQAAALAARHEVEIVSVFRHRDEPALPVPPGVALRPLVDVRDHDGSTGVGGRPLYEGSERAGLPPVLFPPEDSRGSTHSRLTDDRLEQYLSTTDADVVVGTRPGLNVVIARCAPDRVVKVGQEHLTYEQHSGSLRRVMAEEYPGLDAFVTVTEADARTYARNMPLPGVRVLSIPNSVPAPPFTTNGHNSRTIVSAGRLAPSKRHDLLVKAFASLAEEYPDWTLRIYGRGDRRKTLARLVGSLGLHDRVWLMGPHTHVEEAWAQGAFAAVTSSEEPFGMTIVEAMRSGLPVVSTDCPHGPASIIRDQEDGFLVPNKSVQGIAEGMSRLMADDRLRQRMSAAALADSERFDPANVVRLHEGLFSDLAGTPLTASDVAPPVPVPAPRTEPPVSCRVRAGGDGLVTLSFTDPPDLVELVRPGQRVTLAPDWRGQVVVDPARERLAAVTWEVTRVDGDAITPVRDLEIHQQGYPLAPKRTPELSLVIPTRSAKGGLLLHVRRSAHHAEVEHVEVAEGLITVQGRVLGHDEADARARMVVRLRNSPRTLREFSSPVAIGGLFTAVIDPAAVVRGRHGDSETWEMRLVLSNGTECSVGRHLPGVVGYKKIIEYPAQDVRPARGPGSRVRPYYTVNDRLGLRTSPLAPTVEVEDVRVRATARGDRLRFAVRLTDALPEGVAAAVEVVRGSDAGQRYPLDVEGRLLTGTPPLLARPEYTGTDGLRATWQVRLLVGPAGALSRIGAGSVLGHTARRWNHGPYVRSVTASPLANGDLKVTVADVHLWSAINRRLR